MNKLSSLGINIDDPSTGYSEGQLIDNPGDDTGSGAIKGWLQDPVYACYALAKKYLSSGEVSDTPENENDSDVRDSIELMCGVKNENVSEYESTTTYDQDDHVMYLGIQFVSMVDSNTGNNPLDNVDKWLPCYERNDAVRMWRDGVDIDGGFGDLHNKRDATNYREYFKWGKYNFGGNAGRNFQAYGVHLDGQVLTGDTDYEALFAIGLSDEYHLLDVVAPDVLSVRTMIDSKGRVPRIVDDTSGDTEDVGGVQEDAFQGWQLGAEETGGDRFGFLNGDSANGTVVMNAGTGYSRPNYTPIDQGTSTMLKAMDNGTDGTPRTESETRMKNYSVGLKSILVLSEI